ncbi:hypothetical protein CR532_04745 (plasmid) [Candidatus Borreliella tachyglossi]|uniref:Uncharacterized protein n=1 Tax=Candidatus Borreliella tachyglossi TaxID=1964448 RepID=A0A2S1LYE2_9SPIR|nr:hypothetical protein [Candidatus Borreliella tachyglossi]AWG43309.1 hypothetical protein CR532_04745 [Candidatus Borreliella tachyglossi]
MTFKNREQKYKILLRSNLSVADIARVLDVSESAVLKARLAGLGDFAEHVDNNLATLKAPGTLNEDDLDSLARDATFEAYRLEGERDSFHKSFYRLANSYINSHLKCKEITLGATFRKLIDLNKEILDLEREISGCEDKDFCKKLKFELKLKVYKRNRVAKKLILSDMTEDYECLMKIKEIFKSKGLKLG